MNRESFDFEGRRIRIPKVADVHAVFKPGGRFADQVQQVIAAIDPQRLGAPWTPYKESAQLRGYFFRRPIIKTDGRVDFWGSHRQHKARFPGVSPFVTVRKLVLPMTEVLTVELIGPLERLQLIRVYPGEEYLPLPWMSSAVGRRLECIDFWRTHAFVDDGSRELVLRPVLDPPDWFLS